MMNIKDKLVNDEYLKLLEKELFLVEKGRNKLAKGILSLQRELDKDLKHIVRLKNEISKSKGLQVSTNGG